MKPVPDSTISEQEQVQQPEEGHLCSSSELIGYQVEALDGVVGHVRDFLVDNETWTIRYLVIDTGHRLPARKVLVSTQWLASVRWVERRVEIDLTCAVIETAPEFDPERPFRREDEIELHSHYRLLINSDN